MNAMMNYMIANELAGALLPPDSPTNQLLGNLNNEILSIASPPLDAVSGFLNNMLFPNRRPSPYPPEQDPVGFGYSPFLPEAQTLANAFNIEQVELTKMLLEEADSRFYERVVREIDLIKERVKILDDALDREAKREFLHHNPQYRKELIKEKQNQEKKLDDMEKIEKIIKVELEILKPKIPFIPEPPIPKNPPPKIIEILEPNYDYQLEAVQPPKTIKPPKIPKLEKQKPLPPKLIATPPPRIRER
jgi:hypothetical protein